MVHAGRKTTGTRSRGRAGRPARARPFWAIILLLSGCGAPSGVPHGPAATEAAAIAWFPAIDPAALAASPHVDFIPGLKGYQQTTEYTCGPAALLAVARFYELSGSDESAAAEMRIAREAGTRDPAALKPGERPGTRPEEMQAWLQAKGLAAALEFEERGDGSALQKLRENIRRGTPTLVEWIELAGHWVVAVGYDDRGSADPSDDVLIFADPYDRYDDHPDGYTFANAERFYWMWFDARYFGRETWRTMITVGGKALPPARPRHIMKLPATPPTGATP